MPDVLVRTFDGVGVPTRKRLWPVAFCGGKYVRPALLNQSAGDVVVHLAEVLRHDCAAILPVTRVNGLGPALHPAYVIVAEGSLGFLIHNSVLGDFVAPEWSACRPRVCSRCCPWILTTHDVLLCQFCRARPAAMAAIRVCSRTRPPATRPANQDRPNGAPRHTRKRRTRYHAWRTVRGVDSRDGCASAAAVGRHRRNPRICSNVPSTSN